MSDPDSRRLLKEEIVKIGYNKIAQDYQANRSVNDHRKELEEFVNLLPKNAKVLDIGCGAGVPVTKFLVESGFDVTGVDFSESMLGFARRNGRARALSFWFSTYSFSLMMTFLFGRFATYSQP